ncbi:ABC transporter permease [Lachnospiraceae bacterium OttesenSCG-928-D06]|nr:ABC transporter permease [Lachnospiraceae bacterium OttesenSCG-928-D06]
MKKFLIVLEYEMAEYCKSKSFILVTLLLAIGGAVMLFLPRFFDLSSITGVSKSEIEGSYTENGDVEGNIDNSQNEYTEIEKVRTMMLYDEAELIDRNILSAYFADVNWEIVTDKAQIEEAVLAQEVDAGFAVRSNLEFDYYVFNKGMMDSDSYIFEDAMKICYRTKYFEEMGLRYEEIEKAYEPSIIMNEQIMNKDTGSNYWYCYALVIVVFMLIVFYGQMIAVSVTNEKSNRAIEVLVTSTTPNSLLFGKVIAGAIGGLLQSGLVIGAVLISYQLNKVYWGGMLDMVFDIPASVLITFAFFGLGGYLFYAFLYGAVGALVSKTEDISKSSGGLMMVIMIVYFFSLAQLFNIDGPIIKVLSFLPISSYSTMFARIAMGTVATWEIIVSFLILVASIFLAGTIGAKIYRMGTLRYGNPIKFTTALKDIKNID